MAEQQSAQDKLFDAIQEADLERMKLCLENGAEINSKRMWKKWRGTTEKEGTGIFYTSFNKK